MLFNNILNFVKADPNLRFLIFEQKEQLTKNDEVLTDEVIYTLIKVTQLIGNPSNLNTEKNQ